MRRYALYPGCTLHTTGVEYGVSAELVSEALGMELVEIPDWNCCGASSAHSLDRELYWMLPARNLVKAEGLGLEEMVVPCAACYSRLRAAWVALEEEGYRERLGEVLGRKVEGLKVRPRSLLEVVVQDVGREVVKGRVVKGLGGLKVVGYYGCLLVRPVEYTGGWEDAEHPESLERLVDWLGGEGVKWSYGVECCGGSLTLDRSEVVVKLVDRLVEGAWEAGAEAMVTACPMCMANVDGRQKYRGGMPFVGKKAGYEGMPVFYFTELMGLAYGLGVEKVLGKHVVDPRPVLRRRGLL